jgi:hypothetical protein
MGVLFDDKGREHPFYSLDEASDIIASMCKKKMEELGH